MNSETIIYCIFAVILGMLVFHMLKNICGCKVVEGQPTTCTSCVDKKLDGSGGFAGSNVCALGKIVCKNKKFYKYTGYKKGDKTDSLCSDNCDHGFCSSDKCPKVPDPGPAPGPGPAPKGDACIKGQICPDNKPCPKPLGGWPKNNQGTCPPYTPPPPPPPSFTGKWNKYEFVCHRPNSGACDMSIFAGKNCGNKCTNPDSPWVQDQGGCEATDQAATSCSMKIPRGKSNCLPSDTTIQYKPGTIEKIPLILENGVTPGTDYGNGQVAYMEWAFKNAGCGDVSRDDLIKKFIDNSNGKYSAPTDSNGNYKPQPKKGVNQFKWPDQYNCETYNCDLNNTKGRKDHAGNPLKCRNKTTAKTCTQNTACVVGDILDNFDKNTALNQGCCFNKRVPSDGDHVDNIELKGKSCCHGFKWDDITIGDDKCVKCDKGDENKNIANCQNVR